MLSLSTGKIIAQIHSNDIIDTDDVYIKDDLDNENDPEIDCSLDQKKKMFKTLVSKDKKFSSTDIESILCAFENDTNVNPKLQRKFDNLLSQFKTLLKKQILLPQDYTIEAIVKEPSYRIFVSGLSGSGKSYYISQFIKNNRKKNQQVFLLSPVDEDKAYSKIKDLIQISIPEILEETNQGEVGVNDFPEGSIIIFDDIESYPKSQLKMYLELRQIILERGRHQNLSCITVSHNPMLGNITKACIRESQYFVLFPKHNARDVKKLLSSYGNLDTSQIESIVSMKGRSVFFRKVIPQYAISDNEILVI